MRVALVTSDLAFPPREGLQAQTVAIARELRNIAMEVVVTGFHRAGTAFDYQSFALCTGIEPREVVGYSGRMLTAGIRGRWRPEPQVLDVVRRFAPDVVHLDGVVAASLSPRLREFGRVVSFVDPQSRRYLRSATATLGASTVRSAAIGAAAYAYETSLRGSRAVWHVVSDEDAAYLRWAHPGQRVQAIPGFPWPPNDPVSASRSDFEHRIVIVADARQAYLRDAIRQTLAALDRTRSGPHVIVLGRTEPDLELRKLCARVGAEWLSWVDDYSAFISRSAVVVLPDMFGTGLKNRALDVLRLGVPLVATRHALEGLPVRDGFAALVCATPQECADRALAVASSPILSERLSTGALDFYRRAYDPELLRSRWLSLYRRATAMT